MPRDRLSQPSSSPRGEGCEDPRRRHPPAKQIRTRTGCWNCRRKRKKCDEQRPVCRNCTQRKVRCEWGVRLSFRPENLETIPESHPSLQKAEPWSARSVQIIDITNEIIRDYWEEADTTSTAETSFTTPLDRRPLTPASRHNPRAPSWPSSRAHGTSYVASAEPHRATVAGEPVTPPQDDSSITVVPMGSPSTLESPDSAASSSHSLDLIRSAAAHLLDLGCAGEVGGVPAGDGGQIPVLRHPQQGTDNSSGASPASDGIFLPGSAYLDFHSALRDHTFHAARSNVPSRCQTPVWPPATRQGRDVGLPAEDEGTDTAMLDRIPLLVVPTPTSVDLSQHQEFELWKNWVDEVAPWLDKLDNERQFGRALPLIAKEHPHLRFSILALSARQMERKDPERPPLSLALYQEAIHHLIPELQTKTTNVVASCVVLCVLEMMSCSPKMWKRHLDGCASLILSVGIHGLSGGLEQALFWCFARMDLCGGFISDEQPIIPIEDWLPEWIPDDNPQPHLLYRSLGSDMYANFMVYLCARVMALLASSDAAGAGYEQRWSQLFKNLRDWYTDRPYEMKPILDLSPLATDFDQPFPILLFSSPAAICGNQLYHTGTLLMLQQKPRRVRLESGTRSILWHARRISAISISNTNHACWTNCVQPLWFAGQVMSHPAEHRAILKTYELIEKETGWGARWRAEDLTEYWGDLSGD